MTSDLYQQLAECEIEQWPTRADLSTPVVIRGGMPDIKVLTPELFAQAYPAIQVRISKSLPVAVPYEQDHAKHVALMRLDLFIQSLESAEPTYLDQTPLSMFPAIVHNVNLSRLCLSGKCSVNVWIGRSTRSGLHFDNADNLLLQTFGQKKAYLVSPSCSPCLYAYPDVPMKSPIDPQEPDYKRFSRFRKCCVYYTDLLPSDILYIPKGWWHYIKAEGISVSVNCWYGQRLSRTRRWVQYLRAGGPSVAIRWTRDFFIEGFLQHPPRHRLFSPPSLGLQAFRSFKAGLTRMTNSAVKK